MAQSSMLLKLLKNRVIIFAFVIMLIRVEDKVLPFSCVQRRKSTECVLHIVIRQDDDLLTKNSHYHSWCEKKCTDVIIEHRHFLFQPTWR